MQVGLVGFGMVAERFHAPLILAEPALALTHVVERNQRRAEQLYPGIITLTSIEQLLDSPIEIAVILTPNTSHYALVKLALEAGKHVVVDKPFTVTSAQADELIAVAQRAQRVLAVFHNRRWDGDYLTVRGVLSQGVLGRLFRYESRWERFRPRPKGGWREQDGEGTGILYDLGSHMLDQLFAEFGPPKTIFCHLQSQRAGTSAVDCFDWIGDYGSMQAFLSSNCLTAAPSFRFLLQGDQGTFSKSGLDPQEGALQAGLKPGLPGWGEEAPELWGRLRCLKGGSETVATVPTTPGDYPQFYRNLSETILGRASLQIPPEQARDVIRAIELSMESDRKGGWVSWL
jgi:scyllo-inositol 2-dehydrogenase (NADP+)